MPLTPEQASKILEADTRNIVKKVQEGKVLSTKERSALTGIIDETEVASNVSELSKLLSVSRQSIYTWKELTGAPRDLNVEAWRCFIENREAQGGKGSGRIVLGGKSFSTQDMLDLRGLLLEEQTKRQISERKLKEIELAKAEKGWIPYSKAEEAIQRVMEPIAKLLTNFPKRYAIQVNPDDPSRAEKVLRECINEVIRQLHADRGEKRK